MNSNFTFGGVRNFLVLIKQQNDSFAFVIEETLAEQMKMFANGIRTVDSLQEPLCIQCDSGFDPIDIEIIHVITCRLRADIILCGKHSICSKANAKQI